MAANVQNAPELRGGFASVWRSVSPPTSGGKRTAAAVSASSALKPSSDKGKPIHSPARPKPSASSGPTIKPSPSKVCRATTAAGARLGKSRGG
jgi:hypothetical protein